MAYTVSKMKYTRLEGTCLQNLNLLQKRGLKIDNKYNPFLIFNSYGFDHTIIRYQNIFLLDKDDENSQFKKGTKFSDVIDLFYLDMNLKKIILSAMEFFELNLQSAMAYIVSNYISDKFSEYTSPQYFSVERKFKNNRKPAKRKTLRRCFRDLNNRYLRFLTPKEMTKAMTFGMLVNWYLLLRHDIRKKVADYLRFGPEFERKKINEKDDSTVIIDPFVIMFDGFRNRAAHSYSIYNYRDSSIRLPFHSMWLAGESLTPNSLEQYYCGIGVLLIISKPLPNQDIFNTLSNSLFSVLNKYLLNKPNQVGLMHIMGLDVMKNIDSRFEELIQRCKESLNTDE